MAKRKLDLTVGQATGQWMRQLEISKRENTVNGYRVIVGQFLAFIGAETPVRQIDANDIENYLLMMRTEMVSPPGIAPRPSRKRSAKTIKNMHIGLSSFWSWAVKKGLADDHVVRLVETPTVHRKPIQPLTAVQIKRLLDACGMSREWRTNPFAQSARPTAARDKVMILLLVEACLRVSELANLRIGDVAVGNRGGQVHVRDGKGGKDRFVPVGRRVNAALGDYLLTRPDAEAGDYLMINTQRNHGKPMTRGTIARQIKRLGEKAGVDVHPHLLRTTGACMLAANGASAWDLQRIMGHSEVMTTQRYVAAAQIDLQEAMERSSPIDNMRL